MKWIGQHIYDFASKFRNDVYLESISTGTIASGGNLGLDSNNKIVKATETTGDITGVTITTDSGGGSAASDTGGSAAFSILGATGVGVTNRGTTITAGAVPGEIDHDSLNNFVANEHLRWDNDVSSTATIHASNIPTLNQNTTGSAATLTTARAINGVNFNGSAAVTIPTHRIFGTKVKLLPNDFLPNEDGGTSKGVFLDDTAPTGLKPGIADMELVAIADIPEGFDATHVDVYASTDLTIQVYEMDINASGITSRSSAGTANTTLALTSAVSATATNFIAIIVTTTATSNRVWGGSMTITPS